MPKEIAVHFGAGNIGRGFIGWLLVQSGYQVVFADVNQELVSELKEKGRYQVILANEEQTTAWVEGVTALHNLAEESELISTIAEATIVTTAVGPTVLPLLAEVIAKGIEQRVSSKKRLTVIACENMIGGSAILKKAVMPLLSPAAKEYVAEFVSFPNAAVDRIVPNQSHEDKLKVMVEPFSEWVVENSGHVLPEVEGMLKVSNLTPYIERKLFTVNTGHAVTAYLGYMKEIASIEDAIHNERILFAVRSALEETGALLEKKFEFSHEEHQAYIDKIIERFKNPYISDYVTRVGRSPIRKIGENDRFVQPARQFVEAFNETPKALSNAIAAALKFNDPEDEEARQLQAAILRDGLDRAIEDYTGIKPYTMLFQRIKDSYYSMV